MTKCTYKTKLDPVRERGSNGNNTEQSQAQPYLPRPTYSLCNAEHSLPQPQGLDCYHHFHILNSNAIEKVEHMLPGGVKNTKGSASLFQRALTYQGLTRIVMDNLYRAALTLLALDNLFLC